MRFSSLITSFLIVVALSSLCTSTPDVQLGNFIDDDDLVRCQDNASAADKNNDMQLSSEEYDEFIGLYSNGEIAEEEFSEMPLRLVMIFNWIACLCTFEPETDMECCVQENARVDISNSEPSDQSLLFLCSQTNQAIGHIVEEASGSARPSTPATESPSGKLTLSPSKRATPSSAPAILIPPTRSPSSTPIPVSSFSDSPSMTTARKS